MEKMLLNSEPCCLEDQTGTTFSFCFLFARKTKFLKFVSITNKRQQQLLHGRTRTSLRVSRFASFANSLGVFFSVNGLYF